MKRKIKLTELKELYNGCILNKYVKQLLEAKNNDYLIVPIENFTQEYFNLSEDYIFILIRILNDMGYFTPIKDKGISQDIINDILNH